MTREDFSHKASEWAAAGQPFVFLMDFEMEKPVICKPEDAATHGLHFDIAGISNTDNIPISAIPDLKSSPVSREWYSERFRLVKEHIRHGDSYLLNLTFPTPIDCNLSLSDIYHTARAPYRLLYRDEFVVFSPECFVRIKDDEIFTYPMKGTIDARLEDAENKLLDNLKEEWEHNTIVDLMRNDLAMVAHDIRVIKYRFVQRIKTYKGEILQTSSEITGRLKHNWRTRLGEMLTLLLPAGSVSGAPKQKTLDIIRTAELGPRGYYTGVFGYFDGHNLDSAVAIRYIEQGIDGLLFRSGGGITAQSNEEDEYLEMIQKIYVPTL